MSKINLWHGDSIEMMKRIPDASIDLVLTDPPYGTTACGWDTIIPFGDMWEQLKRIIKPNSASVLFGGEPFSSSLRMSNLDWYKYDWMWEKQSSTDFINSHYKPMKAFENISVFSSGGVSPASKEKMPYFPQGLVEVNLRKKRGAMASGMHMNVTENNMLSKEHSYMQKFSNYPSDILSFGKDKIKIHPTQKPIQLMEYLIKTYTNENETVLDFTCGSGSTIVAANNLNRNAIGIDNGHCEKDKVINGIQINGLKWVEIAQLRLDGKL